MIPSTSEAGNPGTDTLETGPLDSTALRAAFGAFATGITVVTGFEAEEPVGFTCQSFHSISLDPPLVSIGVMKNSSSYPRMRASGRFAVNLLAARQQPLASQFARKGEDKWAGVDWTISPLGNPVLLDTLAVIDCRTWNEYEVGDHILVIGEVAQIRPGPEVDEEPLVYFRSRYRQLAGE